MFIRAYKLLSDVLTIPFFIFFSIRLILSKETFTSILEKFTIIKKKRPKGEVVWVNGVSIGEAKTAEIIANQIKKMYPNYSVLLSTSTLASYALLSQKKEKHYILVYCPVDINFIIKRFINYWAPKSTIFIESEIWPNIFHYLKEKSIKLSLFNARISLNSFLRWRKMKVFANQVFPLIENCFVQDHKSKDFFQELGVKKVKKIENLKFLAKKLNVNMEVFNFYKRQLNKMNIVTLFSSHEGEEKLLIDCYETISQELRNIFFIIIPRHVNRTDNIIYEFEKKKIPYILRTKGNKKIGNARFLIVDTFGELGCFFKLSKIALIGGSFKNIGGHNPIETKDYNCCLIFGPHMQNFNDIKDEIVKKKAGFEVKNTNQLEKKIVKLINNKNLIVQANKNFKDICNAHSKKSSLLLKTLLK